MSIVRKKHGLINSVPGGSVLGQVLFVVLLNLLPDEVERSDLFLLPDNRIWYNDTDVLLLQSNISKIYFWLTNSLLHFYPDECYVKVFLTIKSKQQFLSLYFIVDTFWQWMKRWEIKEMCIYIMFDIICIIVEEAPSTTTRRRSLNKGMANSEDKTPQLVINEFPNNQNVLSSLILFFTIDLTLK